MVKKCKEIYEFRIMRLKFSKVNTLDFFLKVYFLLIVLRLLPPPPRAAAKIDARLCCLQRN